MLVFLDVIVFLVRMLSIDAGESVLCDWLF